MNRAATIFLIMITFCINYQAQNQTQPNYEYYQLPDSLVLTDMDYHFDTILNRVQRRLVDENNYSVRSYSQDLANYAHSLFASGLVYEDWNDWEMIVEKIAKDLTDSTDYDRISYQFKVLRDPSINAFATCAGYMFVNVGFLAEIESLEELKLVLGHEIGHILKDHAYEGVIKRGRAENAILFGSIASILALRHYTKGSREREETADQIAIDLLKSKGYPMRDAAKIYLRFDKLAQRESYASALGSLDLYGSTHPHSRDRYFNIYEQTSAKDWSAPLEEKYIDLRNQARYETLYLLSTYGNYQSAIENCWRYLIQDPENEFLKLIMLENLIRLRESKSQYEWRKPIVLGSYFPKKKLRKKIMAKQLNEDVIGYIESRLLLISLPDQAHFDWFISYEELFNMLKNELETSNNIEAKFALSLSGEETNVDAMESYVQEGGRYKHVAERYLKKNAAQKKVLFIPYDVSAYTAYNQDHKSYSECMERFDWEGLSKKFAEDGYEFELLKTDDEKRMTPRVIEMLSRINQTIDEAARSNQTIAYELAVFDPVSAEYFTSLGYSHIVFFDYHMATLAFHSETKYRMINLNSGKLAKSYQKHVLVQSWEITSLTTAFSTIYPSLKADMME